MRRIRQGLTKPVSAATCRIKLTGFSSSTAVPNVFPDPLAALREALKFSPDNLPLRIHLAESLRNLSRFAEAETEYKNALAQWPDSQPLKVGLAQTFSSRGNPVRPSSSSKI